MKKTLTALLTCTIAVGSMIGVKETSFAANSNLQPIEVLLDAKKIQFPDAKPFQDGQGSVMVPIRFVSEALGAKVGWAKENGQVTVEVKNGDHKVNMTVGQTTAQVDGKSKSYGTKIVLKQNRTFVPLRLVSEGLGQTVEWDKVARWVWIGKKDAPKLEESGLKPVSLDPYRKWFTKKPYLLENLEGQPYKSTLIFKITDLPTSLLRDIYSIEPYTDPKTKVTYLKVRSKTTSSAGNLFYLTRKNDIRYRYPVDQRTINNGDGTKFSFYSVFSRSDNTLDGIVDQTPLQLQDIEYIGFRFGSSDYIPMMINPWKGK